MQLGPRIDNSQRRYYSSIPFRSERAADVNLTFSLLVPLQVY